MEVAMDGISRRRFLGTAGGFAGVSLVGAPAGNPAQAAASRITLAFTEYNRFEPLATGAVHNSGFELNWLRGSRTEMLSRTLSDATVDGGETSMLGHLLRLERGDRSHVAVPVFLLRNFMARDIYVRKGSGLKMAALNASRIGIYNWAASGAVWYRHLVRHFGQDPAKIYWIVGGADQPQKVESRAKYPAHVKDAPTDKSLADLLVAGEIDAFFAPLPPRRYHRTDGPIVRLMPDFRNIEQRYFRETRCYPPQHVLVVRKEVWQRDASIGQRLLEAFSQCESVFQAGQRLYPYGTPWQIADIEDADLLMGTDYNAHGLEKNRHVMDVFCQGAFDDGLTARRLPVDEYFAEFIKEVR
jgi:4,5-dihydroxyphthalate decarboxylase